MNRRKVTEWFTKMGRLTIVSGGFLASYVCLTGMLILVISDPILRYLIGRPIYWSNEVSTFLMVMMAFVGFGISFAKGQQIRVTLVFNKLPLKVQKVMWVIVSLATLFYSGFLVYGMVRLAISSLEYRCLTPTAELPFFPFQMFAAIGLIVFFVGAILFAVKRICIALGLKEEKGVEGGIDLGY